MRSRLVIAALASSLIIPAVTFAQDADLAASKPADRGRVVHELVLSGVYQDLPSFDMGITELIGGGVGKPKDFYQLIADLKALKKEAGAEVLVDLSDAAFVVNDAQIAELERVFDALRAAKVQTTAYLENATSKHYLVACLADRIVLADAALIDLAAPAMSVMFFKDAFDLLGIQFQATRAGEFKGAVEPYLLSEMSTHLRKHYRDMIESMNARHVQLISSHRKIPAERVRDLQGRRLILAKAAKESGLVDEIVSWQGAQRAMGPAPITFERVGKKKGKKSGFNFMSLLTGGSKDEEKKLAEDSIAVLHLSGVITDGNKDTGGIVSGPTVALIRKLQANEKIKGLAVRVNSPGGSGTASEAILLALRDFAEKKPVVVSMGSVAASGGYYVAMVGGPVFAEHNTITGSIGVFGMRPNVGALARRVGIRNEVIALDESAVMTDVFRPLGEVQLGQLDGFVRDFYTRFRGRITEVRKNLTDEALLAIAGGRVWSGQQALGLGLVDKLGGLDDAVLWLTDKLDEEYPVVSYPEAEANPFKMLEALFDGASVENRMKLDLLKNAGFDLTQAITMTVDALRNPGLPRAWMLLPAEIAIR
jgi:protease IV